MYHGWQKTTLTESLSRNQPLSNNATDYLEKTNKVETLRVTQKDMIKVGSRMDADEPLITEYNLVDFLRSKL